MPWGFPLAEAVEAALHARRARRRPGDAHEEQPRRRRHHLLHLRPRPAFSGASRGGCARRQHLVVAAGDGQRRAPNVVPVVARITFMIAPAHRIDRPENDA